MTPSVGIVGGGILGMTAAYRLAQAGVRVALYERAHDLGGLVGSFDFDGHQVDRFYHVILPTDDRVLGLAEELGLGDRFRFRPTKVGFYDDGRLFSMTSPKEFLTFPSSAPHDRVRLGAFVARCQLMKGYDDLDDEPLARVARAPVRAARRRALWAPLLDSKFDGRYDDLPATYIWARTRRMSTTRDKGGREVMGWLEGGYQTLIDALERDPRARRRGARGDAVERSPATGGAPTGSSSTAASGRSTTSSARWRRRRRAGSCRPDRRARAGRPLPLPRRRLPAPADAPERQPVLPPEHHRPARPADDGRRDDARRRPGARRRPPRLRLEVRRPGPSRPGPAREEVERDYLGYARTIFPTSPTTRSSTRSSSGRASPSPCTSSAARSGCRRCSRRRGSRSRRRRTSTPRSSAGRP